MPFSFAGAVEDEDGFGDFTFVSSSPTPPQNHHPQCQDQDRDDDDWGDFVQSPQTDPNPKPPPSSSSWQKPKGAIPLSIFGGQEEEEDQEQEGEAGLNLFNHNRNGLSSSSPAKPLARDVKDLIFDLYAQPPASSASVGDGDADGGDADDSWEFKDAFLPQKGGINGVQTVGISSETEGEAGDRPRLSNGESELFGNGYAAHKGTNGSSFRLDVVHYNSVSDRSKETNCVSNGNGSHPRLENEFETIDIKEAEKSGSLEEQKSPGAEDQVFMLDSGVQGAGGFFSPNLGDLIPSSYAQEKDELSVISTRLSSSSSKPNFAQAEIKGWKFHSVNSLDDIISNLYNEPRQTHDVYSRQHPSTTEPDAAVLSRRSAFSNNDSFSDDDTEWEFYKASDPAVARLNSVCNTDKSFSSKSTQNTCLDFYYRLKEGSIFLIIDHLDNLKKSHKAAALSGEEAKTLKINEDIQAVCKVLQEAEICEDDYIGKHLSKAACAHRLVEITREPYVQCLEEECGLSERILSAEKDLSASIELFRHASSVLHILRLASTEEQRAYIAAWSTMALACTKELQHGTMIWKESLVKNVSKEILSRGSRYFTALVEIYRVAKILETSLKLYKPWILSNPEDCSRELVSCLKRCAESWTTSGLEKAVDSISTSATNYKIKMAVKSSKLLEETTFQNQSFNKDSIVCKLSLLPVDKLGDMNTVRWNGDFYCLTLANFWANRVSCDPPALPHIHVS